MKIEVSADGSEFMITIPREEFAKLGGLPRLLPTRLTLREQEVYGLVCIGKQNKEIASELGIAVRTVKFHVSHILEKIGAENRENLICFAAREKP
jgi:DNA-binding NarL/FixJ family response regulator